MFHQTFNGVIKKGPKCRASFFINMLIQINYLRKCKSFKSRLLMKQLCFFPSFLYHLYFFATISSGWKKRRIFRRHLLRSSILFYYKLLFNIVMKTKQDNSKRLMSVLLLDFHTSFPFDHKFS